MNSFYASLWREKVSRRGLNWSFFVILSAVLIVSGFFVANSAMATITSIELTAPNGGENWSGMQNITWNTTDATSDDTISILLSIDSGVNYSTLVDSVVAIDGFHSWDTTQTQVGPLSDGDTYRIRITDSSTGLTYSSSDFTIDNTPPTITDDYVNDSVWVNSAPQTVTLSPIDENEISSVETCEGAGCTLSTPLNSPYQLVYSISQDTIVRYQAWDVAGNPSAIGEFNVRIDLKKPTVSIGGVFSDLIVDKNGATATVECSDAGGSNCDVSNYKYKIETIEPTECSTNLVEYTDYTNPVTITDHSWVCAYVKDNAGNEDFSDSPVEFNIFSTIQDAINDPDAEVNTISVAADTYYEKLDLQGKSLTIEGAGVDITTVNASSLTGYAIRNFGNLSTISDLTLIGSNDYGFKVSGVNNITLENIKVENSYRTGVDLNGVNGGILTNIKVTGTVWGLGINIVDSNDITLTDIETSGNAWGGVSVQTYGKYYAGGSDSIVFDGTFNAQESFPLLLENDPDTDPAGVYYDITNVTLPTKFKYVVYDFREGDDYKQWYYFETLDNAKAVAQTFVDSASPVYSDVIIYDILEKNYYVEEGMEIQDAIDAATADDTVSVATGIYNEQLNIEKSLTLTGAGQDNTHIISPNPTTMAIYDYFGSKGSNVRYLGHRGANIPVVRIAASDVTFEGFHVDLDNQVFWDVLGTGSDSTYSKGIGILVDHVETTPGTPDVFTGINIQNNKIDGLLWNDVGDGVKVLGSTTVSVNNNNIYGYGESAISAQGVDSPTRAAFYPTVTANNNILYGGSDERPDAADSIHGVSHFFFGIGYWSGATGSADGNTIYNAPNDNGYALNSWTPNPVSFTNNPILTDGEIVGGYGAQLYESSNLIFSGNNIQDQGLAGVIWLNPTLTITENTISNCIDGFLIDNQTSGSVTINNNSITGISDGHYAVKMGGTAEEDSGTIWGSWAGPSTITINASENYWGTAVLTTIQNKISDDVIFEPYYVDMVGGTLSNAPVSIVHVDDDYIDGASGGYYFGYDAFDKIQDGVDKVAANGMVNVAAGDYDGFKVSTRENLIISGTDDPVISGDTVTVDANTAFIGVENSTGITIEGLILDATDVVITPFAAILYNNSSGTIQDNTIKDIEDLGQDAGAIWVQGGGSIAVLRNIINEFNKSGILVKDVPSIQIEGNIISTTNYNLAPNGIQIGYVMDPTATIGTVHDNQISGCHWSEYDPLTETYEDDWTGSGILVIAPNSALTISDNEVLDSDVGLDIEAGPGTSIHYNNVYDNNYGFVLWNADPAINLNNISENNLFGVYRTTDGSLDGILNAENNWWGDATGPLHATLNPAGLGDAVSNNVDFNPFYTDAERLEAGLRSSGPINSIEILFDPTSTMVGANSALTLTVSDVEGYTVVNDDTTQFTLSADNAASFGANLLTLTTDGTTGTTITNDKTGIVNVTAVLVNSSITATNQIEFTASDVAGPEITGHTPTDNSLNVPITFHPTIAFNEPLAAGTVNSTNIQLRVYSTNAVVPALVSLVEGGTTVVIVSNENLENNTQYYFAVSDAVTDLTGNPLSTVLDSATKETHKFTTVGIKPFVVDDIIAQSSTATPNDTYVDGWHYTYYLTINATDETNLFVRFEDWFNTDDNPAHTIPANGNMRVLFNNTTGGGLGAIVGGLTENDIVNGFGSVDSYEIGNNFTDQKLGGAVSGINTTGFDTGSASGRQIQFDVFTKIPETTVAGAYEADYYLQLGY